MSFSDIDFSDANKVVDKEKDVKESNVKGSKKISCHLSEKNLREEMKEKYGKAIMDGKEVEVGNYMAEPPGIFIGRGEHPIRGTLETKSYPKRCDSQSRKRGRGTTTRKKRVEKNYS